MTEIPGRKGKSVLDSAARCSPMRTHPSAGPLPMITGFIESGETLGISLLGWVHWCSYCCNGWKHANRKLPKTCKPRHMFRLMFLETEGLGQSPAQKREEGRTDFISAKVWNMRRRCLQNAFIHNRKRWQHDDLILTTSVSSSSMSWPLASS